MTALVLIQPSEQSKVIAIPIQGANTYIAKSEFIEIVQQLESGSVNALAVFQRACFIGVYFGDDSQTSKMIRAIDNTGISKVESDN